MLENIIGLIVLFLMILLLLRTLYNNYILVKCYKAKYGKPIHIFCRISNIKEFELFNPILVYKNFLITNYSGKDLIIPRNSLAKINKNQFLLSFFRNVCFKIFYQDKYYKILTNSPIATKTLEQFLDCRL